MIVLDQNLSAAAKVDHVNESLKDEEAHDEWQEGSEDGHEHRKYEDSDRHDTGVDDDGYNQTDEDDDRQEDDKDDE